VDLATPLQAFNRVEVRVIRHERHLMLQAQRRNPEVVFWNRFALLFQREPKSRIDSGRGCCDL
jgi:hypothetical protein